MIKEFVKTDKINSLENEINDLENELINKKNLLREEIQREFDKQFELIQGKTVLKCEGKEYVYVGLSFNWGTDVQGSLITKNGFISKKKQLFYYDWIKTGKEYNR